MFELEDVVASFDGIALRAGVGNATLYRNFSTRDAFLAEMMESELDHARGEAKRLVAEHAPENALAEWLIWLTRRLRIWHDLPHCVAKASAEQESSVNPGVLLLTRLTGDLLAETQAQAQAQAQAAGAAVRSLEAGKVFELATAISWAVDRFGDDERAARRRVGVATAGLATSSA